MTEEGQHRTFRIARPRMSATQLFLLGQLLGDVGTCLEDPFFEALAISSFFDDDFRGGARRAHARSPALRRHGPLMAPSAKRAGRDRDIAGRTARHNLAAVSGVECSMREG